MKRMILAALGASILTGCVQTIAEDRVRDGLVRAGVPEANADCMAERMAERLSVAQLRKLERIKPLEGERARPATLGEFVTRARRVGDAEVVAVTASSAALCATGLG